MNVSMKCRHLKLKKANALIPLLSLAAIGLYCFDLCLGSVSFDGFPVYAYPTTREVLNFSMHLSSSKLFNKGKEKCNTLC